MKIHQPRVILHVDGCNGRIEDWKNDEEKHFAGNLLPAVLEGLGKRFIWSAKMILADLDRWNWSTEKRINYIIYRNIIIIWDSSSSVILHQERSFTSSFWYPELTCIVGTLSKRSKWCAYDSMHGFMQGQVSIKTEIWAKRRLYEAFLFLHIAPSEQDVFWIVPESIRSHPNELTWILHESNETAPRCLACLGSWSLRSLVRTWSQEKAKKNNKLQFANFFISKSGSFGKDRRIISRHTLQEFPNDKKSSRCPDDSIRCEAIPRVVDLAKDNGRVEHVSSQPGMLWAVGGNKKNRIVCYCIDDTHHADDDNGPRASL